MKLSTTAIFTISITSFKFVCTRSSLPNFIFLNFRRGKIRYSTDKQHGSLLRFWYKADFYDRRNLVGK